MQQTTRNLALDAIKGLCIILMVVGHSGAPYALEKMISSFHMPAFFIISGFLFKEKYMTEVLVFIKRKMKTIWWPYVFWTIIFLLLHNFFADLGLYDSHYTPGETAARAVKGVTMRQTEQLLGGFWFLTALLFASTVSLLYYKFCGLTRGSLLAGIAGALAITECIKLNLIPEIAYFNAINFQATAFFMTGTLFMRENFHTISRRAPVVIAALLCITVGTFWLQRAMTNVTAATVVPYYITATLITWGLIVVFWKLPSTTPMRYLVKIGSRTLDILIFHFISFKLLTLVRIAIGESEFERLADFPVINFKGVALDPTDFFWIGYSIIGLAIPLLLSRLKDSGKRAIKARHERFPTDLIP